MPKRGALEIQFPLHIIMALIKKMVRTMYGEVLIKHGPFDLHALEKWWQD